VLGEDSGSAAGEAPADLAYIASSALRERSLLSAHTPSGLVRAKGIDAVHRLALCVHDTQTGHIQDRETACAFVTPAPTYDDSYSLYPRASFLGPCTLMAWTSSAPASHSNAPRSRARGAATHACGRLILACCPVL